MLILSIVLLSVSKTIGFSPPLLWAMSFRSNWSPRRDGSCLAASGAKGLTQGQTQREAIETCLLLGYYCHVRFVGLDEISRKRGHTYHTIWRGKGSSGAVLIEIKTPCAASLNGGVRSEPLPLWVSAVTWGRTILMSSESVVVKRSLSSISFISSVI